MLKNTCTDYNILLLNYHSDKCLIVFDEHWVFSERTLITYIINLYIVNIKAAKNIDTIASDRERELHSKPVTFDKG